MKTSNFNTQILDDLKNYFNDVNKFNMLLNDKCCISGSFILKHINNDDFICSDIDIYIYTSPDVRKVITFLNDENYLYKGRIRCNTTVKTDYDYNNYIDFVFKFENKQKNKFIDLVSCSNHINAILDFDLKIVKNYYDGSNTYIEYPNCVFNKIEKVNLTIKTSINMKHLFRIQKYIKRGYNIQITKLNIINKIIYYNKHIQKEIDPIIFNYFRFKINKTIGILWLKQFYKPYNKGYYITKQHYDKLLQKNI